MGLRGVLANALSSESESESHSDLSDSEMNANHSTSTDMPHSVPLPITSAPSSQTKTSPRADFAAPDDDAVHEEVIKELADIHCEIDEDATAPDVYKDFDLSRRIWFCKQVGSLEVEAAYKPVTQFRTYIAGLWVGPQCNMIHRLQQSM